MSGKETMTDVAYNWMSKRKKEVDFLKLWNTVSEQMQIPEEKQKRKKSQFYSDLMLDNRFASLGGNKWDLRNRRKFDEVHVDTSDIELEDDDKINSNSALKEAILETKEALAAKEKNEGEYLGFREELANDDGTPKNIYSYEDVESLDI